MRTFRVIFKVLIFSFLHSSFAEESKSFEELVLILQKERIGNTPVVKDPILLTQKDQFQDILKQYLDDSSSGSWDIDSGLIRGRNGGRGPGGGDGIFCQKDDKHPFSGWYSYDFIQSRTSISKPLEKDFSFSNETSCLGYMKAIQNRLKVLNPLFAIGLEHYLDSSPFGEKKQKSGIKREWRPLELGENAQNACLLFDVKDENENISLGSCQKCQLFIRKYSQSQSKIFYLYHQAQLDKLMERPRQCSYAVLHEWARDFLPDSQDLYDFVAYLHSKKFFTEKTFKYVGLTDDPKKRMFTEQGNALRSTSLDLYFKLVSQVPASPGEVKEFQESFLKQFQSVVEEIDRDLVTLERFSKKDSLIPNDLHLTGKQWLEDIQYRVRTKQITLGKAFQELIELQSSIPIMKGAPDPMNNPFFMRMMLSPPESLDALDNPWNKFTKPDDEKDD